MKVSMIHYLAVANWHIWQKKKVILVSYSYVFLQCVDIIRDTIAVEVVLGRLDNVGVPNLTKWCRKPSSSSKVPSEIRIMAVFD